MGAGSGRICSFSHHTTFSRPTAEEFLSVANRSLEEASARWKAASKVIVTLGTAWCFEHIASGEIVSNCLKRDAKEFSRRRLSVSEVSALLGNMVTRFPDKSFIFTVSPIRHLKDGAHGNQLSKSVLLLAIEETTGRFPERTDYFPAYEIFMDELRDYLSGIENLYCVGRNGQHRYNNIDHSMCTSFETVKNILSGKKEKDNIWNVNTEQEYHEVK